VVTILFVDLVGFTERSDRADPEDVRRTLVPFHSAVKADIERYGGTLDKFIGDAVMGVFGAPVAHEDDPARAVRSALKILRSIEELRRTDPDIAVRIAVNTGEAVVSFGTGPQVGEAVAGDVVNTTSRMQGLAPRDSVVIGETTLRAVRDVFDVELVTSSTVKGKAEPITVWRGVGERLRGAADLAPGAFVGRRHELDLLRTLYARSAEGSSLQVVTLVGEPGIGKSRLLREFRRTLDPRPRWVTGECVPYGEMVTFAPVADTLREVTGIDPADSAVEAGDLLSGFAAQIEHDRAEREWLLSRLKPVLGLESADRDSTIPPEETAQAWARVMGSVADSGPLVVELADLHWAEPALIEAVERLAGALAHRPVLLLCTARPDLLEHHPGWGRGRTNATVVELPRLTAGETAELLSHLLAQIMLPPTALDSLLERAGGNPLYAVEFARMLDEHVTERAEHLAMPSSVQAVIAARLDAIPADLRALVHDASVVGTAFWPAALAALGDRPEPEVRARLQALVQRGIVESSPVSSVEGQAEFGFSHALVREVAYGRIPRAERARLHCTAGTWLERASGDRADERAELLARHFAVAVDLAEAAGERDVAEFARRPAVRWLMTAGERAALLDAATAFGLFDRAATLAPHGGPERATALEMSARMGRRSGSLDGQEVLRRYEAVLALRRTLGDPRGIGRALTRLGSQASIMGDTNRAQDLLREAVRVLEPSGPSRELALAYAYLAEEAMFRGHVEESMLLADRTLDLQLATSDDFVRVMALHIRGDARCSVGDLGGLEDLEEALRLAEAVGEAGDIVTSHNYLAEWIGATQGPAQAVVLYEAGLALAERRGVVSQGHWTKGSAVGPLFEMGDWDRAVAWCDDLLAVDEEWLDGSLLSFARTTRSRISLLRGRRAESHDPAALVELARRLEELPALAPALVVAAELAVADGSMAGAAGYLLEFEEATADVAAQYREAHLAAVARVAVAVGEAEMARIERMLAASQGLVLRDRLNVASVRAIVAEHRGDLAAAAELYRAAAEGWRSFGNPLEEAEALLGLARCVGDDSAADAKLARERAAKIMSGLGINAP